MSRKELIAYIRKSELFFANVDFEDRSMEDLINIKAGIDNRKKINKQIPPAQGC